MPLEYSHLEWKEGDRRCEPESSDIIRRRVEQAQKLQFSRYRNESFCHNSDLTPHKIREYCVMSAQAAEYLKDIFQKMDLVREPIIRF